MIIHLISSPRTISTALMYSFAQRKDTVVWDEPFYGIYLSKTGYEHPGRMEIMENMPKNVTEVLDHVEELAQSGHVFIKNIASHFKVLNPRFCEDYQNILLIRDPGKIVISFDKVIHAPTQQDIGIKRQFELYHYLHDLGRTPMVIDSTSVAENPGACLVGLCSQLGLEFDSSMLSWPPGPKKYDGIWAPYWYTAVQKSTGFHAPSRGEIEVPEHLENLYNEALTYYNFLIDKVEQPNHATDL